MKLSEALILRADCVKKVEQLKQRLIRSAKTQEGETPAEDPNELIMELEEVTKSLTDLVTKINKTNSMVAFRDGMTIADALAARDSLLLKRGVYNDLVNAAAIKQDRFTKSEVKFISTVNVAEIQKKVDELSKTY